MPFSGRFAVIIDSNSLRLWFSTLLNDLHIPSVLNTSSADLIADLFVPLLRESVSYDRGIGYFSLGRFLVLCLLDLAGHEAFRYS